MPQSAFFRSLPRRAVFVFAVLGLGFWGLYFATGMQVGAHGLFKNDVFFHSDTERVVNDLTLRDVAHHRTSVHPLFVLLTNPLGLVLTRCFGAKETAAVLLNSLAGATTVALAGWFLVAAGLSLRRATLFAAILGCSAAHLFFGSLPETYAFSALSIVLLFCCMLKAPGNLRAFGAAGLFSFGMLITNLGFAAIAFFASLWPGTPVRRMVLRTALYLALVLGSGAALACVQKAVWPRSALFFIPHLYAEESRFVRTPDARHPLEDRIRLLSRYVFVFDWVTPPLFTQPNEKHTLTVRFDPHLLSHLRPPGRAAAALWIVGLAAALAGFLQGKLYRRPLPLSLPGCLLFYFVLHTFYGDDLFLYSCNSCFLLLAWIALCMPELALVRRFPLAVDGLLTAFLCLEITNNWPFWHTLVSIS